MIKKTISSGLVLALCLCTSISIRAQRVVQGESATITYIENAPIGADAYGVSSNGKYIVGGNPMTVGSGFAYSVDSAKIIATCPQNGIFLAVANTGKIVGSYFADFPGTSIVTSGIWRNNKWDALQLLSTGKDPIDPFQRKVGGPRISADGSVISGQGFTNYYYKDEPGKFMNQGGLWHDTVLYKTLIPHFPYEGFDFSGYGCGAYNISADGKVALGSSAIPGSYTNTSPVTWVGDTSYSYAGDRNTEAGVVNGSNADGSILVGQIMEYGVGYKAAIWRNGVRELISDGNERSQINFMRVGENGIVLTKDGRIWTKELGLMYFGTFLSELYGLNNSISPTDMSTDGRVFVGGTAFVTLGDTTINTRPKSIIAKQERGSLRVNVSWTLPYENGRAILGYNVYRDSVKVNSELITEMNFTDPEAKIGLISYTATAVYATGESKKSPRTTIDVIAADGCYSVKSLRTYVDYNRTVTISWQAPNDAVVRSAAENTIQANFENVTDTNVLDLVELKALGGSSIAAIQIGNKYYVGDWVTPGISVYDLQWKSLGRLSIRNLPPIADFASDGEFLYAVCKSAYIFKINLEDNLVEERIEIPSRGQHLAFVPSFDNGNGGFEVGDWNSSFFVKRDGTKISEGLVLKECAGTTFYDGKIYASQQTGDALNQVIKYDPVTKERVGEIFEPNDIAQIRGISTGIQSAGGISVMRTLDSTLCLSIMVQTEETANELAFFELEPSPEILGYNLYRNGVHVNTDGLLKRHSYSEIIEEPGTYTYKVTAKFRNGCEATPTVQSTVTITPITGCAAVKYLGAAESYRNVELRWDLPATNTEGTLAGFYIYRDGTLLNSDLYKQLIYTDFLPSMGTHVYRVEAFYDNSCTASDSVSIEVTNQGFCLPATNVSSSQTNSATTANTYDINLTWDLPYFEEPLPLRYGNGQNAGSVGAPTAENMTVAAAWDSAQLKVYKDFKLVGMEIFIADPAVITPLVLVDDSIVYQFDAGKIELNKFSTVFFDRSITFEKAYEMALGYTMSFYEVGDKPAGVDAGPAVKRRGDLYTLDFKTWSSAANTIGVDANWNIAALLVKSREIDTDDAATIASVKQGRREIYKVDMASGNLISKKAPQITTSNSADIKLSGFNVYRDGTKLNATPVKASNYLDASVAEGKYSYTVGSLWSTCEEMMSEAKTVKVGPISIENEPNASNLSIYPNPAKDFIVISGEYTSLEIVDLSGHRIATYPQASEKINISHLNKGVYMLRFQTKESGIVIKKIIVQ